MKTCKSGAPASKRKIFFRMVNKQKINITNKFTLDDDDDDGGEPEAKLYFTKANRVCAAHFFFFRYHLNLCLHVAYMRSDVCMCMCNGVCTIYNAYSEAIAQAY